jgi:prolyl oligopeptidase
MKTLPKKIIVTALLISSLCTMAQKQSSNQTLKMQYPETKKDSVIDEYFGMKVSDPYRWLEDDTSLQTSAWVKKQNAVTRDYLSKIPFRKAISERYESIFNYEKYSAPFQRGDYIYYSKNSGLQNQFVIYREPANGGDAEIFLDPNTFSADGTTSLGALSFSKDGSMATYNISEGGSDWQKMLVMDAKEKKLIGDTMLDIKFGSASWNGNDGFYYETYDRPKGGSFLAGITDNHKLLYHKLGTPQAEDQLIYGGVDQPRRYISGGVTEDEKWLIITAANSTYGNELLVLDLTKENAMPVVVVSDMKNQHTILDNDDKNFYIQTDRNAPNGKIVSVAHADPAEANWKVLIPEKTEVLSANSGGGYLFCSYLIDAITKVYQYNRNGEPVREIGLPGPGTATGFGARSYDKELYYSFTSYTTPATIFKFDIGTGKSELYKQPELKFNPADYESKQIFYTSKDGTKVPMMLTYKKGLKTDGQHPCLLYGYGGFGVSLTPAFSTSAIILLENGGVFAVPNIRGGGEYGQAWHEQGIKMKKQNVFDDFMAAADYLVNNKYTSREKLAIEGGSNGGLLVGACITQDPSMCKVAFPAVGVLDMLRYHKFTAGAGWAYDYGTSEESQKMFEYLYQYSPLHNLKPAAYPATMVTTADHDDRVVPAHSFKFAAALQQAQTGPNPVLIRIETKAGHGAGTSTRQIIEQQTDKWSFMFFNMGIVPKY